MKTDNINWERESYNTLNTKLPNGEVAGLFYDSKSKQRHISIYEPYKAPPRHSLCGKFVNFSATATKENICQECLSELESRL